MTDHDLGDIEPEDSELAHDLAERQTRRGTDAIPVPAAMSPAEVDRRAAAVEQRSQNGGRRAGDPSTRIDPQRG